MAVNQVITARQRSLLHHQRIAAALALLAVAFMLPLCCLGANRSEIVLTYSATAQAGVSTQTVTHVSHDHRLHNASVCDPSHRDPDTMHAFLQRVSAETMHRLRLDDDDEPVIGETLIPLARIVYAPLPVLHAVATSIDNPPPRRAV